MQAELWDGSIANVGDGVRLRKSYVGFQAIPEGMKIRYDQIPELIEILQKAQEFTDGEQASSGTVA